MDLIKNLSSTLGVESDKAEAVAGAVLGGVRKQVAEDVGAREENELSASIPELDGWEEKAKAKAGSAGGGGGGLLGALGGGGGGLLGALGGGGGGFDIGAITGLLSKLNITPEALGKIAPVVINFLKERLPASLFDKVMGAVPGLKSLGGSNVEGAISGALGGLFGKK